MYSSLSDLFLLFKVGWNVFEKQLSDAKNESCTDTTSVQGGNWLEILALKTPKLCVRDSVPRSKGFLGTRRTRR
jgi:hypothetical protein